VDQREDARAIGGQRAASEHVALAALVQRYQQPLGAYVFYLTGDLDLALAITRETFIRCRPAAVRHVDGIGQRAALYRFATRLALGRMRDAHPSRRRRIPRPWARRDAPPSGVAVELGVEPGNAERGLAQAALRGLAPGERAVLLLGDLERFPLAEVAAILDVSRDAALGQLARARARFRLACVAACRARA
jgi:DNA-directed RNA polymerase specialized sigma24 family protein